MRIVSFLDQVADTDNLFWAWKKCQRMFYSEKAWFDRIALTEFESHLSDNLADISSSLKRSVYSMQPLRLLMQPKGKDDKGRMQVRQSFWISVRDQVTWTALVNVIGPNIDASMPAWSYGNRLHRSVWFEESAKGARIKRYGWYRHTPELLYRRFPQSWPLFRRHAYLVVSAMSHGKASLDEYEEMLEADNENATPHSMVQPFIQRQFWPTAFREVFWAGVDFERFYPRVNLHTVKQNLLKYSQLNGKHEQDLDQLLSQLLSFPLDLTGWSQMELAPVELDITDTHLRGIPTRLHVAGFLSNVALLEADLRCDELLRKAPHTVAQLRYADDHIVLASSPNALIKWLSTYARVLSECNTGAAFNPKKSNPEDPISTIISGPGFVKGSFHKDVIHDIRMKCRLDPANPTPLMTKTLAMVSGIAATDFMLLQDVERGQYIRDLEHLLLAELDDDEMRRDTRMSFAAARLTHLMRGQVSDHAWEYADLIRDYNKIGKQLQVCLESEQNRKDILTTRLTDIARRMVDIEKLLVDTRTEQTRRLFALLLRAVQENPSKLALWDRVLGSFLLPGLDRQALHSNMRKVLVMLKHVLKDNEQAGRYLRAYTIQQLTGHVLWCCRDLLDRETNIVELRHKSEYLAVLMSDPIAPPRDWRPKFYERNARMTFLVACSATRYALEKGIANSDNQERVDLIRRPVAAMRHRVFPPWDKGFPRWARRYDLSVALLGWWLEHSTTSRFSSLPSAVWNEAVNMSKRDDKHLIPLLSLYPKRLPYEFLKENLD